MKPVISRFHLLGIRRLVGLVGCVVSIAVDRRNRRNVDAVSRDFFVQAKRYVFLFALEFNFFVEYLIGIAPHAHQRNGSSIINGIDGIIYGKWMEMVIDHLPIWANYYNSLT